MRSKQTILKCLLTTSITGLILLGGSTVYANNPPPSLKVDAPNRYIVKKGDTLWGISGRYLNNPLQWKKIWAANKQIKNPNLIYPGDILILCVIKGQTLVGIDTGKGCAGVEEAMSASTSATSSAPTSAMSTQSVTITALNNSIPPIPLSAIQYWLERSTIVNPTDLENTPYILASKNRNLLTSAGDKVYAKGVPLIVGQKYGIYRVGEPYVDGRTQKVEGVEVKEVASGVVTAVAANGVSSINLLKSYDEEVREGDRVFIGLGDFLPPVFYPTPAKVNRGGLIVRVMDSISQAAKGSVITVNLGSKNGAKAGDVLDVYHKGALVRDVQDNDAPVRLPSEIAGHVMIFKTFENLSYAYVLDSEMPLSVGDQLLSPIDY